MNIRTSIVKPLLFTLCLIIYGCLNLYCQKQSDPSLHFVDSLNLIIKSLPAGSKAQRATMLELRERLIQVLNKGSFENKYTVAGLMQDLDSKIAHIPIPADTISNEVIQLEKQLGKLQDSIVQVQKALKKIIEDNEQSSATREKAVFTLAKIHDTKVLDYLFENEEKLQFTKFDPEDDQEMYRTVMVAIGHEYYYKESTEAEKWLLFNYLLHNLKEDRFQEAALIISFLTLPKRFKSQELLLEFMYANSDPVSKKVLEFFLPEKTKQKD